MVVRVAIAGSSGLTAPRSKLESEAHEIVRFVHGAPDRLESTRDPVSGWAWPGAFDGVDAVVHLARESRLVAAGFQFHHRDISSGTAAAQAGAS